MEQKRRLRIVGKTWETDDTATFTLEMTDGQPLHYRPGQYLTLIFEAGGKEKRRAYSFSTCPGVDELPAITVRRVVNGEFSNRLLAHAGPGDMLTATEPHGQFLLPEKQVDRFFYIAAGSGITPVMSHLKMLLFAPQTEAVPQIMLYYANRDSHSTIFKARLDRWTEEYSGRFSCLYLMSREKNAAHSLNRHLNNELLEQLLLRQFGGKITARQKQSSLFGLCAPKALMRMTEMTLRTLGFPEKSILKEAFTPETRLPLREPDRSKTHTIVASGKSQRIEFQTFEGETILDAALRQGIALPYTCKSGVCFTCLAKCVAGAVDVAFVDATTREGPGQMVNTCIGYAATERVELVYE